MEYTFYVFFEKVVAKEAEISSRNWISCEEGEKRHSNIEGSTAAGGKTYFRFAPIEMEIEKCVHFTSVFSILLYFTQAQYITSEFM